MVRECALRNFDRNAFSKNLRNFQKSENLVKVPRNCLENIVDSFVSKRETVSTIIALLLDNLYKTATLFYQIWGGGVETTKG